MKAEDLEMAPIMYKANIGVGTDGFHRKAPLHFSAQTCGKIVVFLYKVEQCGYWPVQASTLLFFILPKNVTGEGPISLLPTLIRWREWLGAPVVQQRRKRCKVSWDGREG